MSGARQPAGRPRIWLMDADGRKPMPLTPETYEAQYPAWSPDGKTIAFSAVVDGAFRVLAMDPDGRNVRQLTDGPQDNWPSWSPDGRLLIFGRGGGLAIMRSDGSEQRMLTEEVGVPAAWAPGDYIVANCSLRGDSIGVCLVGSDGSLTPLLAGLDAGFPTWKP